MWMDRIVRDWADIVKEKEGIRGYIRCKA